MSYQSSPQPAVLPNPTAHLDATFELEPTLALKWLDTVLARQAHVLLPQDVIYLLHCRATLAGTLPPQERVPKEPVHPGCEARARAYGKSCNMSGPALLRKATTWRESRKTSACSMSSGTRHLRRRTC